MGPTVILIDPGRSQAVAAVNSTLTLTLTYWQVGKRTPSLNRWELENKVQNAMAIFDLRGDQR
jgi:hypothetical protein